MVFGANSKPTGIPNLVSSEHGNFVQHKIAQLWYSVTMETAQLGDSPGPGPLSGYMAVLCCSMVYSVLLCACLLCIMMVCFSALERYFPRFSSARKMQPSVFSLTWKEKVLSPSQRGAGFYRQMSPLLGPAWSVLMQMRAPNHYSFICPKGTVAICRDRPILIARNCLALIEWGKSQSYWLK